MLTNLVAAMKACGLVLIAWVVIGAAAPSVMAQSCCRCDFNGNPESCNTGITDQASCESVCTNILHQTFGQFQTCPAGMVLDHCSQDQSTYCDAVCVQATPTAAPAPTTSTTGTLLAVAMLVGFGVYSLRRAGQPSGRLNDSRQ